MSRAFQPEIKTDGFAFTVVPVAGVKERVIIVRFSRIGDVVTQVLSGVVLDESRPLAIDAIVPTGLEMGANNPYAQNLACYDPCVVCPKPCFLFRRLRRW